MSGLLLIDKEKGPTSHDVVDRIRRILKIQQVGHAGTLDPFATGLLVVGVGKATRLLEYLQNKEKVYEVKMKLGVITDTFDITGKVVEENEIIVTQEDILKVINSFVGSYKQVPPAYSAKKYQGRKLYELAREGKIINLPPREVSIYEIKNIRIDLPYVEFETKVSSGTYIRSLCMDIGYSLGCGATAVELRRTKVGKFQVEKALKLENLEELVELGKEENILSLMIPMEEILDFPKVNVKERTKIYNGIHPKVEDIVNIDEFKKDDLIQVFCNGKLIAVAQADRSFNFIKTLKHQGRNERIATLKKVFKDEC